MNEHVKQVLVTAGKKHSPSRGSYADYIPEDREKIGKYAAENGPARAIRRFSVPETTARRLKTEYLQKLKTIRFSENTVPVVKSLPTKTQGRPLLIGLELDQVVQNYVNALRTVGGVVKTAIVMVAAEGVVSAARGAWRAYTHYKDLGNVFFEEDGLCEEEVLECWEDH